MATVIGYSAMNMAYPYQNTGDFTITTSTQIRYVVDGDTIDIYGTGFTYSPIFPYPPTAGTVTQIDFWEGPGLEARATGVSIPLTTLYAYYLANDWLGFTVFSLSGNDTISAQNTAPYNDMLYGYGGNDTISGFFGDDVIYGGDANDLLYGGEGNDTLIGGPGDDTLDGGHGIDSMAGGPGNDVYVVDNALDIVVEFPGEGSDTVVTSVSIVLPENVENGTYVGPPGGSIAGNALDNVITGDDSDNVLDGGGGQDTLVGGAGNDTYHVDNPLDTVLESSNSPAGLLAAEQSAGLALAPAAVEGIVDTVIAAVSYSLADAAFVENLTLAAGTAALTAAGNELDNALVGNALNNTLNGFAGNDTLDGGAGNDTLDGGSGIDTLTGGAGDDLYIVDSMADTIVELPNGGTDSVWSSVTFSLAALAHAENLTLGGSANIDGTGNALGNVVTGNAGSNALNGAGGTDTLIGGDGDDTYIVDSTTATIVELADGGTDAVRSSITFSLTALTHVENLTLVGSANINGTGNALDNLITGNAGSNVLDGGDGIDTLVGGDGADKLVGGAGDDTFDGGFGVDTAVFSGTRSASTIAKATSGYTVSGADGTDALKNIERLEFSDAKLALDLDAGQSAGNTVRIIGAAFDAPAIQQHPDWVGLGFSFFDSGMSMQAVCELVVPLLGLSNTEFVTTVYTNVVGAAPPPADLDYFVGLLEGGATQADLLVLASNVSLNEQNINLAGLQQSGVEFV